MSAIRGRPTLALAGAASCGGCELAVLNLGQDLLELEREVEIVFAPALADHRLEELLARPQGGIDLALMCGAIRTAADLELAHLLRSRSRVLVALGSCAEEGCVPALANLRPVAELLRVIYAGAEAPGDAAGQMPRASTQVSGGELTLPCLCQAVLPLGQVERVEYAIPGCPPEPTQLWAALQPLLSALLGGSAWPPPGTVLGASGTALCEECPLTRNEGKVARFFRLHELVPEPGVCLLEQGLVCLGVATRGGCGARCLRVGIPCRGCYGTLEGSDDQGASMVAALAAVLDNGPGRHEEGALEQLAVAAATTVVDPVGTFYRFSLASSLLARAIAGARATHEPNHD